MDHRLKLLELVAKDDSEFVATSDTYKHAHKYFDVVANNVKAELHAAFVQGCRGNGALLTFMPAMSMWTVKEGEDGTVKNMKGCVVQDVDTKQLFWITRSNRLDSGQGTCASFKLEGIDEKGNGKTLEKTNRKLRVVVFAADYAARFAAAYKGAQAGTMDDKLLAMVLKPSHSQPGTFAKLTHNTHKQIQELNESQRDAVLGLKHRLEIIHGPPGTGKSTTIVGLLRCRVPFSRTSCVTCVTNQALEAVSAKLQHTYEQLRFVVLGNYDNLGPVSRKFLLEEQVQKAESVIEISKLLRGFCDAAEEAQRHRDSAGDESSKQMWANKLCRLQKERDSCRIELDKVCENEMKCIVRGTKVFLCTAASLHRISTLREEYEEDFPGIPHTVILDEAGATPESYIPQVLAVGTENLILLGDHKQLPPLVVTMNLLDIQEKGVNRSLMERALKTIDFGWVHSLKEQYRMPPPLCDLVSKLFYKNELITASSKANQPHADPVMKWLVVRADEVSVGTSKVNLLEAAIIVDWLRRNVNPPDTFKVITFYKRQRDLVRMCLADRPEIAEMVVSVDASQGSESDHILLSTVRSNPKGDVGFCADPQRLCVALSRAKSTLTVLGDPECMGRGGWEQVLRGATQLEAVGDKASLAEVTDMFKSMQQESAKPCRYFFAGGCTKAECPFLHEGIPDEDTLDALRASAKPCMFFAQGKCTKGSSCTFSHDFDPSNPHVKIDSLPTRAPCHFYANGRCNAGDDCPFSHDFRRGDSQVVAKIRENAEICKFFARGRCTNTGCTFSHSVGTTAERSRASKGSNKGRALSHCKGKGGKR